MNITMTIKQRSRQRPTTKNGNNICVSAAEAAPDATTNTQTKTRRKYNLKLICMHRHTKCSGYGSGWRHTNPRSIATKQTSERRKSATLLSSLCQTQFLHFIFFLKHPNQAATKTIENGLWPNGTRQQMADESETTTTRKSLCTK